MANKKLFSSAPRGQTAPPADTINAAGGKAYKMSDRHALAQASATGCFANTFYLGAQEQLSNVLELCAKVDPKFVAQCAVYSRMHGYMKDMPAFMAAFLAKTNVEYLKKVFPLVIDSPKMLRNFVQVVRSGTTGRKSLGHAPKKLVLDWIQHRKPEALFRGSIGNDPSLADVIKMVHPRPADKQREALYGYLIGKKVDADLLPKLVQDFEAFKKDPEKVDMPPVPFLMVTALPLTKAAWKRIAEKMSWTELRMNLNTLERHEVLKDKGMVKLVADKLRDRTAIEKSRAFPYQIMTAYSYYEGEHMIKEALQDAMDIAVENVPKLEGNVVVAVDVSGSMQSPITGHRNKGATSKMRCVDVAALFSACILKKNPSARIMPFHGQVLNVHINPRDSIMTNAEKLYRLCNNGTNVSAPLQMLVQEKAKVDTMIYFSDMESWMDRWLSSANWTYFGVHGGTSTQQLYNTLRAKNPNLKMVCVDLTPNTSVQAKNSADVLNIGGFSDVIFDIINEFSSGKFGKDYWTKTIEQIDLNELDKFSA